MEISKSVCVSEQIDLLLDHARSDTGGSRRAAAFLLSLWDGDTYKADLQELLYTDKNIHVAMVSVFMFLFESGNQLFTYVTDKQMQPVIARWGDVFDKRQECLL